MRREIQYKPNKHQKPFHEDITSKFLHLSGGFGSGKTYSLVMKLLQLSYFNAPFPGGLVVPTYADYVKDVLPTFEEVLDANRIRYKYHRTEKWFRFPWSRGKLYVVTGDKRIRGPSWSFAGINELTLMGVDRYREVASRVRIKGANCPQIASSGTPEGIASEYYEVFEEKPWKNSRIIYGCTDDNMEHLDSGFMDQLESAYDPNVLKAYRGGQFVNMNGSQFYYSYSKKNEDTNIKEYKDAEVCAFVDFNVDPMVATFWHYFGDELLGFFEIVITGTDTTNKMIKAMKAQGFSPKRTTIFPDPAGRHRSTQGHPDVEIFRQAGYTVRVRKAAPSFRARQLNMNNLLHKRVIRFNPLVMPYMKKDFLGVEQDKMTYEKIKKNPRLTHASDGIDYGTDILFPFSGKRAETRVVKFR